MLKWKQEDAPTMISATLNRYNYIDFKLWNQIKNNLNWQYAGINSILITRRQVKMSLELHYPNVINLSKVSNFEDFKEHSNSIYFIWKLILNYPNLKYFLFVLNDNANYTRITNTTMGKVLRFNYRFVQATIRLADVWSPETIKKINPLLKRLKLLSDNSNQPYNKVFAQDLIALLDGFSMGALDDELDEDAVEDIISFLNRIDDKFEEDNPMVLLITDYL